MPAGQGRSGAAPTRVRFFSSPSDFPVRIRGGQVAEPAVCPFVVVEAEVPLESGVQRMAVAVFAQVDILVLHAAPGACRRVEWAERGAYSESASRGDAGWPTRANRTEALFTPAQQMQVVHLLELGRILACGEARR